MLMKLIFIPCGRWLKIRDEVLRQKWEFQDEFSTLQSPTLLTSFKEKDIATIILNQNIQGLEK